MDAPDYFINRCFDLAQRGLGTTAPNPLVGAVLVHNGWVIGEGWHQQYGGAHAEVNCIQSVSESQKKLIKEAVLYVNLEPCSHFGKTPPCVDLIIKHKIKKVVISNQDPFEKVDGQGINLLQENGIEVVSGVLEKEGRWINRRFFTFHKKKRPYIILKWAQSADGFLAPLISEKLQLSNPLSQIVNHRWRSEEAAILIGRQTAEIDNPALTTRNWKGKNPIRIIIDKELKLTQDLNVFNNHSITIVINQIKDEIEGNVEFCKLDFGTLFFNQLMNKLYLMGVQSVIVEGGAFTHEQFLNHSIVDEIRIFLTPVILNNGLRAPKIDFSHCNYKETLFDNEILTVFPV